MVLVASSSQDLESDDARSREWLVCRKGLSQTTVTGAASGSLELDPGRAIDKDHGVET
jgi:hypothetical protein